MKTLQAGFEIMNLPEPTEKLEVLKHLERIGRVCYKSEANITDDSCIKFIKNIRDRKHWAMLEHYIFVFSVSKEIIDDILDPSRFTPDNVDLINRMPFIQCTYWENAPSEELKYIVSASATALNYLWECNCYKNEDTTFNVDEKVYNGSGLLKLCSFMMTEYPELMKDPMPGRVAYLYDANINFVTRDTLNQLPRNVRLVHDSMSVKITCDRGVTHELVRHRPTSWAQESTRYCNYSSGKFNNEISVIDPIFFTPEEGDKDSLLYKSWKRAMNSSEMYYNDLIEYGATPQEARTVLPTSTKAEICMTARMFEMRHFFDMRADNHAHPQMKEIVYPMLATCILNNPDLFGDMSDKLEPFME